MGSCGNKTIDNGALEVIKINPNTAEENINLSEIVDSIKCIKLQTDSNDVMGKVRDIIIKNKYIYAVDVTKQDNTDLLNITELLRPFPALS